MAAGGDKQIRNCTVTHVPGLQPVDAQLPPGLVRALAAWGHTAEHVFDHFPPGVSDSDI